MANFSVCHELLDLFFVISETKNFKQGKVVISKNASFFLIKDALVGLLFSQFCILLAVASQRVKKFSKGVEIKNVKLTLVGTQQPC